MTISLKTLPVGTKLKSRGNCFDYVLLVPESAVPLIDGKTAILGILNSQDVPATIVTRYDNGRKLEQPHVNSPDDIIAVVKPKMKIRTVVWMHKTDKDAYPIIGTYGESHVCFGVIPDMGNNWYIAFDDTREVELSQ